MTPRAVAEAAAVSISRGRVGTLVGPDQAARVEGLETSSSFFPLLGARAVHGRLLRVDQRNATTDYFRTMKIPLQQGRFFEDTDLPMQAAQVAIVRVSGTRTSTATTPTFRGRSRRAR